MAKAYRILLADDYLLFRREIRKFIEKTEGLTVVAEASKDTELFQLLEETRPDLVLIDISMPNTRAMEATRRIKEEHPQVKVLVMVLDHEVEYLSYALRAGADGVVLKQYAAAELIRAIRKVKMGKFFLPALFKNEKKTLLASVKERCGGLMIC
jgi:DNA-binding NarL/FixJ family response regulator